MKLFSDFKKWYVKALAVAAAVGMAFLVFYIIGCQDLQFEHIPDVNCDEETDMVEGLSCGDVEEMDADIYNQVDFSGSATDSGTTTGSFNPLPKSPGRRGFTLDTKLGKISALFVLDNSPSMKEELASIANQFDRFLDTIRRMDYRIAIVTTDSGYVQFLTFSNGQTILSNPTKDRQVHKDNVRLFQETVQQPAEGRNDERGVYALNQVVRTLGHTGFFVPHSLFLAIIVSDEDERSYGGVVPEGRIPTPDNPVLPLEEEDKPTTLFRNISQKLPFITATVHAIIVPPGDASCRSQSGGIEGRIYAQAAQPSSQILSQYGNIRKGHIGSICSSNYSSQLGPIADMLIDAPSVPLHCIPKKVTSVRVGGKTVSFQVEGRKIIIKEKVPLDAYTTVKFYCQ
ncbi:MAG: VWA domain-containing protein [Oligoflexia bacterium]|nr:VWA domain-containing protein [Oligoflexia bacterium]